MLDVFVREVATTPKEVRNLTFRRCFVLVDWWGQVRSSFLKNKIYNGSNSEGALRKIESLVEMRLKKEAEQPRRWEISFRLYAGWLRGGSATEVLRDFDALKIGYAKRRRIGGELKHAVFMPEAVGLGEVIDFYQTSQGGE